MNKTPCGHCFDCKLCIADGMLLCDIISDEIRTSANDDCKQNTRLQSASIIITIHMEKIR